MTLEVSTGQECGGAFRGADVDGYRRHSGAEGRALDAVGDERCHVAISVIGLSWRTKLNDGHRIAG